MVDFLMAVWNGWSGIFVLIVHAFGGWQEYPFFDTARQAHMGGNWYDFGFFLGVGTICGLFGTGGKATKKAGR